MQAEGTGHVSVHMCVSVHIHDKRWAAPSQSTLHVSSVQASINKSYSKIRQQKESLIAHGSSQII